MTVNPPGPSIMEYNELRLIQILSQVLGLSPYTIGPSPGKTHLSVPLVIYNIAFSIILPVNTYYSEIDVRNNGYYSSKSDVVDTAFDLVDWLGNIYVTSFLLLSIVRYKDSRKLYFKTVQLDERFQALGIKFDQRKRRRYFLTKLGLTTFVAVGVLVTAKFMEESAGSRYTDLYWFVVMYPLFAASVVIMIFGTYIISFYAKIWSINEMLRVFMAGYLEKKNTEKIRPVSFLNVSYEKKLEQIILSNRMNALKDDGFKQNLQNIAPRNNLRKKPLLIFIENYPQCFKKEGRNLAEEINILRQVTYEVLKMGEQINTVFGPHLLSIFVWFFFGIIIHVYSTVAINLTDNITNELFSSIMWATSYLFCIIYVISFCNMSVNELKTTASTVNKFWAQIGAKDFALKKEVQSFAFQLGFNQVEFTAFGFFKIDSTTLFSFVSGVISNIILFTQFDKLRGK